MTTALAPFCSPDRSEGAEVIAVPMGGMAHARGPTQLTTVGLGSCVAVVIFAPRQNMAALAHCMLPVRDLEDSSVAKFADSAVPALLALLDSNGASAPFSSALVGGASMFPGVPTDFMRDVAGGTLSAARLALADASIPVRVEDVGGHVGRSVVVNPVTQRVLVRTIRDGERWL